jgi:hypothetical protein
MLKAKNKVVFQGVLSRWVESISFVLVLLNKQMYLCTGVIRLLQVIV